MLGSAVKSGGLLEVVGQYQTGESYGALYPKNSENAETLNKIIEQMKADGTFAQLESTYLTKAFGGDPSRIPLWQAK